MKNGELCCGKLSVFLNQISPLLVSALLQERTRRQLCNLEAGMLAPQSCWARIEVSGTVLGWKASDGHELRAEDCCLCSRSTA